MNFYQRKLYALLQAPEFADWGNHVLLQLDCLNHDIDNLNNWWNGINSNAGMGKHAQDIASSSDRVNLFHIERRENTQQVTVRHPISGQKQQVTTLQPLRNAPDISQIKSEANAKKVFWWFWRFYPELLADTQPDALLFPAHTVIPDCPLHSHQSTVSALTGAMFPKCWKSGEEHETPYLLTFSFSPVQDFIKSSRKFLDFWAGSYLLHYLSTQLCWHISQHLGPDAIIIPSLWSQEIIDALIVQKYHDFAPNFTNLQNGGEPVNRFTEKISTSLSTAGFPNVITILVPGKQASEKWGRYLTKKLTKEWIKIGIKVRNHIREQVINFLDNQTQTELNGILHEVFPELKNTSDLEAYQQELNLLKQQSCWEWNKLWSAQLNHTWEPYWTAIPLGSQKQLENQNQGLIIDKNNNSIFDKDWIDIQNEIAQPFDNLPSEFENNFYISLNVGTWWGSIHQRLGRCLNNIKYTRNWQIATAPGERSTISGQFSAVHPRLNYQVKKTLDGQVRDFRQGSGLKAGSMRLFWFVMSKAYRGLFNGSEKLNALELTKRMAWVYGDVAKSLGISIELTEDPLPDEAANELGTEETEDNNQILKQITKIIDYEKFIRFPNLSSIAAAAFASEHPNLIKTYRTNLYQLFNQHRYKFSKKQQHAFYSKTSRPFHISNADKAIQEEFPNLKGGYNGVMFSSKWLIDDMSLQEQEHNRANNNQTSRKQVDILREIVEQAHQNSGFGDSSPADWWVIVLADGDGMGDYVSGKELEKYDSYVEIDAVDQNLTNFENDLFNTLLKETKRMGPATHVGLNRALLDFSNRLVPYLTEKRFCGRVIYSGGDDVMAVLPPEDLPEYLLSLRAAWSGGKDPKNEFANDRNNISSEPDQTTGYWYPGEQVKDLLKRPHFTMGRKATMSAGVIVAHKSVPLPTVLESVWQAEAERAKKIPDKDGICFRIIYGGGNQLEALMKGELLDTWWDWVKEYELYTEKLSPLLHRLAEELPRRASVTEHHHLFSKAARVIMDNRDRSKELEETFKKIEQWLDKWEEWAKLALRKWAKQTLKEWAREVLAEGGEQTLEQRERARQILELQEPKQWDQQPLKHLIKEAQKIKSEPIGIKPEDLAKLLKFTAFWIDKRVERSQWKKLEVRS
ncbi:type III-B CRISPR-associated protein Cas10/Cmr2 [Nostoc sp. KVJ3]|uniref:type III-B CRISPR-associated protein Cas10/Cmr2 n=1 Tax=Nostoc sp. KVJ3 TaxID=457945 RepID=UPI002238B2DC|nr:type III-B CRISPR-associated protein Cas10/Cmr2 [Nostoc sp. KVJ3]MCW5317250.1 type III-B CRISPR-associated protein Cas10/Cmr2 [Nostoc sp. KVJ3]